MINEERHQKVWDAVRRMLKLIEEGKVTGLAQMNFTVNQGGVQRVHASVTPKGNVIELE